MDTIKQAELNKNLIEAIQTGTAIQVTKLLGEGANPNFVMDDDKKLNASMLAASVGDIEKLDALKSAGADLTIVGENGQSVANSAALNGHLSSMNFALNNGSPLDSINVNDVTDQRCRQALIAASISQQVLVKPNEVEAIVEDEEKLKDKVEVKKSMGRMRPPNAFESMIGMFKNAVMVPVTKAKMMTWQENRHEYLLKNALETTKKHETELSNFMRTGKMGHIMSDINALGNNPADIHYAIKNTKIGQDLNLHNRMAEIDKETLLKFDREGRNVESAWKKAIESNTAAGKDVSEEAKKSMGSLAKTAEVLPRKISKEGDVEFFGDKIKEQLQEIIDMAIRIGQAVASIFTKKAP